MRYHAARAPQQRIMAIDLALRADQLPDDKALARKLEVDPRTIRRDLEYMRDTLHAPIAFDRFRRGYWYTEPTFRLSPVLLTQGELISLLLAERMMRQFRGTPFEPDIRSAIDKLGAMLPDRVSIHLDNVADFLSVLPATECEYDPKSFNALTSAIVRRRRLVLRYWSASRNETTRRLFDPYALLSVHDGWYAIGHCHQRVDIRMFAIQRVESLRETGETFDRPADFRVEEYLKGSFRAFRGAGDHRVVLRFKPEVARRFAEKKWHASQALEPQQDGSLIARLYLNSLVEVKRWVMWWGADCEVVAPKELRESIVEELKQMLRNEESPLRDRRSSEEHGAKEAENVRAESKRRRRVRPVG